MAESKTFVFGQDANNGMLSLLTPLLQKQGLDPNMVMAMMNNRGGFGNEGGWFMWIIFLLFWAICGGNGFGGFGYVFAATMCKADYLGKSIPDKEHLAMYVKDTIDDVDASDETTFRRWVATMVGNGLPIDWYEIC